MANNNSGASAAEARGAVRWLLGAGGMAILLSLFLFWADNSVMEGARDRDVEHNKQLLELRSAQASLSGAVNDPRQLLPLTIEEQGGEDPEKTGAAGH
jgi:hypothetical protein